jgi:hypothetical protein
MADLEGEHLRPVAVVIIEEMKSGNMDRQPFKRQEEPQCHKKRP